MKEINLKNYIHNDSTTGDCSFGVFLALKELKKSGGGKLVVPEGEYHFYNELATEFRCYITNNSGNVAKKCAFLIDGFENIEIAGENASFIFHGTINPFIVNNSKNIKIAGLTIDWHLPLQAQAVILTASPQYVDIEIDDCYQYRVEKEKLYIFGEDWEAWVNRVIEMDKEKLCPTYNSGDIPLGDNFGKFSVEEIGNRRVRIKGDIKRLPQSGNFLVFHPHVRICPAITLIRSENVNVANVVMHHAGGMGIVAQMSGDITVDGLKVSLKKGRAFTLGADGVHFANCYGSISVENCLFENQMDDALNVHGNFLKIIETLNDRTILASLSHYELEGVEFGDRGDTIQFVNNATLLPYEENEISDITFLNRKYILLELKKPVSGSAIPGHVVENLTKTPSITFKNCIVRNNRARGLLLKTPKKTIIENNYFRTAGAAIMIKCDANFWFESGACRDVEIKNNVFDNCKYVRFWGNSIIDISPDVEDRQKAAMPVLSGIRIHNNTFHTFHKGIVYGYLCDDVSFYDNIITTTDEYEDYKLFDEFVTIESL